MKPQTIRSRRWLWLLTWALSFDALAQGLPSAPQAPQLPVGPASALPLPTQQLPAQPTAFDPNNPAGTSPRFLFASALAMVAKDVGVSVVSSLSQGIVNWFNRSGTGAQPGTQWTVPPPMMGGSAYPGTLPQQPMAYPQPVPGAMPAGTPLPGSLPPGAMVPGATPPGAMPPGAMPPGAMPPPYMPSTNPGSPGMPGGPFPATGTPMTGAPMTAAGAPMTPAPGLGSAPPAAAPASMSSPLPSAPAPAPTLYAGIAFEVHVLGAGGTETTVDPGSYVFHSGERFLLYYRPSLPGRVRVFNVSPTGEVIPIETLTLAGAQLAKLGPYQLTDPAGDEALRLVLEPCSSPELVAATRNIVKATDSGPGPDLSLGSCPTSAQPAAGVGARNIVKTTMDGNTGFALDPVNSQELASGRLTPRETTIAIHHR
jgi:hypothetical protein